MRILKINQTRYWAACPAQSPTPGLRQVELKSRLKRLAKEVLQVMEPWGKVQIVKSANGKSWSLGETCSCPQHLKVEHKSHCFPEDFPTASQFTTPLSPTRFKQLCKSSLFPETVFYWIIAGHLNLVFHGSDRNFLAQDHSLSSQSKHILLFHGHPPQSKQTGISERTWKEPISSSACQNTGIVYLN